MLSVLCSGMKLHEIFTKALEVAIQVSLFSFLVGRNEWAKCLFDQQIISMTKNYMMHCYYIQRSFYVKATITTNVVKL